MPATGNTAFLIFLYIDLRNWLAKRFVYDHPTLLRQGPAPVDFNTKSIQVNNRIIGDW